MGAFAAQSEHNSKCIVNSKKAGAVLCQHDLLYLYSSTASVSTTVSSQCLPVIFHSSFLILALAVLTVLSLSLPTENVV